MWTVQAIFQFHFSDLDVLKSLITNEASQLSNTTYQNVLFDEDPVNTYAEEWVFFQIVIASLRFAKNQSPQFELYLSSLLDSSIANVKCNEEAAINSLYPFTNSSDFLILLKSLIVVNTCSRVEFKTKWMPENMHPLMQKYLHFQQ